MMSDDLKASIERRYQERKHPQNYGELVGEVPVRVSDPDGPTRPKLWPMAIAPTKWAHGVMREPRILPPRIQPFGVYYPVVEARG